MLLCGDGVVGCHGYIEHHGEWAKAHGMKVAMGLDAAQVPLQLASGRLVLLDPVGYWYIEVGWAT